MEPDRIFIDIKTCDMTLSQVMLEIARLQSENPEYEIFMDGDRYAIVGRRRTGRWDAPIARRRACLRSRRSTQTTCVR